MTSNDKTILFKGDKHFMNTIYNKKINDVVVQLSSSSKLNVYNENYCSSHHTSKSHFRVPMLTNGSSITREVFGFYCFDCEMYNITLNEYKTSLKKGAVKCRLLFEKQNVNSTSFNSLLKNYDISTSICADFLIRINLRRCGKRGHQIFDIKATINIITKKGQVQEKTIPGFYCEECNLYFIYDSDYNNLRKSGNPLCPIYEYSRYFYGGNDDFGLNPESILHSYGYNVNANDDLSDGERHMILEYVISSGIMSKHKVLDFLNSMIHLRENNYSMYDAIDKWQNDSIFVSESLLDSKAWKKNVRSITITR